MNNLVVSADSYTESIELGNHSSISEYYVRYKEDEYIPGEANGAKSNEVE